MSRRHRFDSVPSPRLMRTIGATALDAPESVAELVANCIDARSGNEPVHIEVSIDDGRIEVIDDASGMDLDVLQNAIRLGVDMDALLTREGRRMGTYGLGMKTAAASLGDTWGIVTRPASRPGVEFKVEFDLREFSSRGAGSSDWSVEVLEEHAEPDGMLGDLEHGTAVWITKLRSRQLLPGPFLDFLGRAFGPYARSHGDKILVNGREAVDVEPDFVEGSRYDLDTVVSEDAGWHIKGWVALDKRTHNRGDYGLHLYRNGQLVETWNKSFFPAHLMTSRILGVAHLDFVPVNFNKKGFETSSEAWEFTKSAMREALKPLVEASRTMSRGRGDETKVHRALSKMREALGSGTGGVQDGSSATQGGPFVNGTSASSSEDLSSYGSETNAMVSASRNRLELPRGTVVIDCTTDELDSDLLPWDYVYDIRSMEMLVILNTSAAVFAKTNDVEFLACLAIADCIARVLQERESIDPTRARRVRDQWLHEAFVLGFQPTAAEGHGTRAGATS